MIVTIGAIIGGILYRLGGKEGWNTKYRDMGLPTVFCLVLGLLGGKNTPFWGYLSLIPTFGLMMGALTTYRYFLPKPKDYLWYHYSLHGFMVALSAVFFAWATGHWVGFGIRAVLCSVLLGLWSQMVSWDELEEWGRGFFFISTVPLLLYG